MKAGLAEVSVTIKGGRIAKYSKKSRTKVVVSLCLDPSTGTMCGKAEGVA